MDGMYAMDLKHPYRLVFTEKDRVLKIVKILKIIDYH
nr:MAG TPA: antidote protein [Caudoviricetes sp.]